MRSISLLPPEIRQVRRKNKQLLSVSTGVFVLTLLCIGVLIYLFIQVGNTKSQVEATESEITQVENAIEELQDEQDAYMEIIAISEIMEKAQGEIPNWQNTMTKIGKTIPMKSWLSDLSMQYEEGDGQTRGVLTIKAYTFDYSELTTWLVDLNDTAGIDNIEYKFLEKMYHEDMDFAIYAYEISAEVNAESFAHRYLGEGGSAHEE